MKCKYEELTFRKLHNFKERVTIDKNKTVIGFDTETIKGNAFLLSDSNNRQLINENTLKLNIDNILSYLTYKNHRNTLNFFFNIDFDVIALFKYFDMKILSDLYILNFLQYKDYKITYIPKKYLKIKKITNKKDVWQYFDIQPFISYPANKFSLNTASKKYLNKQKLEIEIENFDNTKWIKKNLNKICEYCYQDCKLTRDLGYYFKNLVKESSLTLNFNKPISPSYVAEKYIKIKCNPPKFESYFDKFNFQKVSWENYYGGRFEIFKKGYFDTVTEYDIKNAYSKEFTKLIDFRLGKWEYDNKYTLEKNNPFFAFINCDITFKNNKIQLLPLRIPRSLTDLEKQLGFTPKLVVYPKLIKTNRWLTLNEYNFFKDNNLIENIKIKRIQSFYPDKIKYPYKKLFFEMFKQRNILKEKNNPIEQIIKLLMNSPYGKLIQVIKVYKKLPPIPNTNNLDIINNWIEKSKNAKQTIFSDTKYIDNGYLVGKSFYPIYAHIITSETRLKLLKEMIKYPESVYGCFTDCILTDKHFIKTGSNLGDFEKGITGEMVLLGSGVYTIRNNEKVKSRYRGFSDNLNLFDLLKINKNKKSIEIPIKIRHSLGKILTQNKKYHYTELNKIINDIKVTDINFDKKRNWNREFKNCNDVLKNQIDSKPLVYRGN